MTLVETLVVLAAGILVGAFVYPAIVWLRQRIRPDDTDEMLRSAYNIVL